MMPSRFRSFTVSGELFAWAALSLVLLGIAVTTYGKGAEDWHYKLAGLKEDPPFLRGMPELSVSVGIVISGLIGALALLTGAADDRVGRSPERTGHGVRWRGWWWLLIAGWGGYVAGIAVVIAGGGSSGAGPVSYPGNLHVEFGAPLSSSADVPATCR